MKSYKTTILYTVIFQPFCFAMEQPDENKKTFIKTSYSLAEQPFQEILDADYYLDNNIDKAKKEFQEAIKLWRIDSQNALRHLWEAEKLGNKEAKEKLNEIRQSKGYNEPKAASKNDPGMLLKFFEMPPRAQYNAIITWKEINNEYALDYFIELAESEDTPKNIKKQTQEQLTKIRKTNGYRNPYTIQPTACCQLLEILLAFKQSLRPLKEKL